MKILINTEITSDHRQQIQSVSPDLVIVEPKDEAARLAEITDTDILFGDFNRPLFDAARQLKWVQVLGAGVTDCFSPNLSRAMSYCLVRRVCRSPPCRPDVGADPRFDTRRWSRRTRTHMGKPLVYPQ